MFTLASITETEPLSSDVKQCSVTFSYRINIERRMLKVWHCVCTLYTDLFYVIIALRHLVYTVYVT